MSFTKIPKFRRFVLQNFPFIEQDFDALTDYGLICKVVEYLNKVINQTNTNTEQFTELSKAFNNLVNYVDHYFDDLDVQTEINNKLDQMAEDGTLGNLLSVYVQPLISALNDKVDENYTNLNDKLTEIINSGIAPIPVSSTSGMTDTSRIYVNTTDGKWYYWDGAAWTAGGDYQASEDSDTVMIADSTAKGLGLIFTNKGMIPLRRLYTGYLSSQTGEVVSDNSRVYTSVYVEDDVQRIIPDSGYAVSVYMYDKTDDSYVGRMLQDYTLSNSVSPSPAMKWFTDLDLNFVRGKYPNYGIKLVLRKDDYSSIQDMTSWIRHFKTYIKDEEKETILSQNSLYEFQIDDIWARGEIENAGTIANTNSRLYTTYYIPSYVNGVIGYSSRVFKVHAYKKSDDSYVGKLNEDGRFAITGTTATPSRVNFDSLRREYPEYEFKLTVFVSGSTNQTTILRSDQIKFLTARKMQETITSRKHFGYEVKEAANIANHDMTYVGAFIYLFDAPSSGYDGKFNILNSDLTINRTKYTNFNYLLRDGETRSYLRMKSVDFNPTNEILMVANGQLPLLPNDSYIFMFYDAKSWKNSNIYNYTFENCGEYKQIDVSALGDRVYAFWKTYEETDEIYVTINNLEKIYLIELGKGTKNLGMGVYESASAGRYNGSYRIVEQWTQLNANIPDINAHGGQVYNGELYLASNNEFECVIYKAILGDDGSLKFEKLDLNEYKDGVRRYEYIDGMLIKDGVIICDPLKINEVYHTDTNKVLLKVKL